MALPRHLEAKDRECCLNTVKNFCGGQKEKSGIHHCFLTHGWYCVNIPDAKHGLVNFFVGKNHMNFKPADNYKDLLTQAQALASLVRGQSKIIDHYAKKVYLLSLEMSKDLHSQIDSERAMNAELTNELEKIRRYRTQV